MLKLLICVGLLVLIAEIYAQTDSTKNITKTGLSFGGVPVVAYNTDKGFQYGIAMSIYNFADGSYYPNYKQSLYLEWSRTTKKNGINQLIFDARDFFSTKLRLLSELNYITDKLLPFYGFNGYNTEYKKSLETENSPNYISRAFYRLDRTNFRATADIQGNLRMNHFRWVGGLGYTTYKMKPVDIKNINSSLDESEKLPDVPGLYDEYVSSGIIPANEKNGGEITFFKGGIVYDTRNNEANASKGIWAESVILTAPSFVNKFAYTDLILIFRHYFTLFHPRFTMANRLGYQGKIFGDKPFFAQPYLYNSYRTVEAFGGVKTVRGIMANRIVGDGVAFGNFELRYKPLITSIFNQDFYLSTNAFFDWGMVTQNYSTNQTQSSNSIIIKNETDRPHFSTGLGLRLAFNQNFIIAADYGVPLDSRDGTQALYVALDFLY